MSGYKTEQHYLTYRGRRFHFVSYEGQPANVARAQLATDPSWFLMAAGKRWGVMPYQQGLEVSDLDRAFERWLDAHVF